MEQEKSLIEVVDSAIREDMGTYDAEEAQSVSRKPFRITDFDAPYEKEMAVFTHAKKLSEYIFVITQKSPVKLRWSIVSRLINCSVDVIENLYRANYEKGEARLDWQKRAMVSLNLLDFYAETAKTKQAINFRQMTLIGQQIAEVKKLLRGWVKSTRQKDGIKD
ncbi:MAG: four helix bundle protein [Clostridia bacterium]|nr:four helix bundle protein [Clostridia bacterium]